MHFVFVDFAVNRLSYGIAPHRKWVIVLSTLRFAVCIVRLAIQACWRAGELTSLVASTHSGLLARTLCRFFTYVTRSY